MLFWILRRQFVFGFLVHSYSKIQFEFQLIILLFNGDIALQTWAGAVGDVNCFSKVLK